MYYEGINDEPEEVTKAKHNHNENDKYTQYLQQKQKQYERLALGSLLPENIENYQNKANELQNQIESSKIVLSYEEQYAVNQYISSESYKINEALRNDLEITKQQEKMMSNLDKMLNKMPTYEGIVQRSLILDNETLNEFLKIHKTGNKIQYKQYISTTIENRYNDLSNVELHIKSKNGRDIRTYNREEQEILFKRNSSFKVNKIKKINDIYYIFMEEIDG